MVHDAAANKADAKTWLENSGTDGKGLDDEFIVEVGVGIGASVDEGEGLGVGEALGDVVAVGPSAIINASVGDQAVARLPFCAFTRQ
jgi:hypothetical protein